MTILRERSAPAPKTAPAQTTAPSSETFPTPAHQSTPLKLKVHNVCEIRRNMGIIFLRVFGRNSMLKRSRFILKEWKSKSVNENTLYTSHERQKKNMNMCQLFWNNYHEVVISAARHSFQYYYFKIERNIIFKIFSTCVFGTHCKRAFLDVRVFHAQAPFNKDLWQVCTLVLRDRRKTCTKKGL